jgi:hypothetical protein
MARGYPLPNEITNVAMLMEQERLNNSENYAAQEETKSANPAGYLDVQVYAPPVQGTGGLGSGLG